MTKTATTKTQAMSAKPKPRRGPTKLERLIAMLRRPEGASVAQMSAMTGWKTNSIRGVLAGALKLRYGLTITSEKPDGVRIYRTAPEASR
jgi:hypothetical protein